MASSFTNAKFPPSSGTGKGKYVDDAELESATPQIPGLNPEADGSEKVDKLISIGSINASSAASIFASSMDVISNGVLNVSKFSMVITAS